MASLTFVDTTGNLTFCCCLFCFALVRSYLCFEAFLFPVMLLSVDWDWLHPTDLVHNPTILLHKSSCKFEYLLYSGTNRLVNQPHLNAVCLMEDMARSFTMVVFSQLLTLESSFHQIHLCLVEMQNAYHFALAALDWLEVFVPRYNGLTPSVSEVAGVMGAIVYDIKQASCLVWCGMPVWIIHGFGDLYATHVDELLPISEPSDMPDLMPAPGSAIIFRGSPGSEALQCMVRYYSRLLAGVNPFISTTPLTSTSSRPSSALMSVSSTSSRDARCAKPCEYWLWLPFCTLTLLQMSLSTIKLVDGTSLLNSQVPFGLRHLVSGLRPCLKFKEPTLLLQAILLVAMCFLTLHCLSV